MAKILVATDKPFEAIAVKGIREVVEGAGDELILLEKYGEKAKLLEAVKAHIFRDEVRVCLLIPYTKGDISSYLCEKAKVNQMDYRADGTWFDVELKEADYQRLKEYEVTES